MMVCAHGNVTEFCNEHNMVICDTWDGDLIAYRGPCRVLVTDSEMSENEYYFRKGEMLAVGIELVSTRYVDDSKLSEYLVYSNDRRRKKRNRKVFDDSVVIARILELRAAGKTLRAIREDEGVHHMDGRKLSISTIAKIIERENKESGR